MIKIKANRNKIISQIANCETCDWDCQDYKSARSEARKHTLKTGHKTWVETVTFSSYEKDEK